MIYLAARLLGSAMHCVVLHVHFHYGAEGGRWVATIKLTVKLTVV